MCSSLLRVYFCSLVVVKCAISADSQTTSTPATATTKPEGFDFGPFKSNFRCPKKYGYYADVENNCRVFHLCNPRHFQTGKTDVELFSFLCPPNTIFNQQTMNCARREDSIPCHEAVDFYFVNDFADFDRGSKLRIRNVRGDFDYNALEDDLLRSRLAIPQIFTSVPIEISGPRYLPDYHKTTYLKSNPQIHIDRDRVNPSKNPPPAIVAALLRGSLTAGQDGFEPAHDPKAQKDALGQSSGGDEPLYVLENLQLRQLLKNLFEVTAKTNATFEQALSDSRKSMEGKAFNESLPEKEDKPKFDIIDFRNFDPVSQPIAEIPVYLPSASNVNVLRQSIKKPSSKTARRKDSTSTTETPRGLRRTAAVPTLPTRAPAILESSSPSVVLNNYLVKSQASSPKIPVEHDSARVTLGFAVNRRVLNSTSSAVSTNSLKSPPSSKDFVPTKKPPSPRQTQVSRPVIRASKDREDSAQDFIKARDSTQSFGRRVKQPQNIGSDRKRGNIEKQGQKVATPATTTATARPGFIKNGATNTSQPEVLKILERSFKEFQELILRRPFKQEVFLKALDLPLKSTGGSLRQLIEAQEKLSSNRNQSRSSSNVPLSSKESPPRTKDSSRTNLDFSSSGRSEVVLGTRRSSPTPTPETPFWPEIPNNAATVPPPKRRRKARANPLRKSPAARVLKELPHESTEDGRVERSRKRRVKRIADGQSSAGGTIAGAVSFAAESIPNEPLFVWNSDRSDPVFFNVPLL